MNMTLSQMGAHQSRVTGVERLIKTHYWKNPAFKSVVDSMLATLSVKEMQQATDIAVMVKHFEWDWMLEPICTCPSGDGSLRHPCPKHNDLT